MGEIKWSAVAAGIALVSGFLGGGCVAERETVDTDLSGAEGVRVARALREDATQRALEKLDVNITFVLKDSELEFTIPADQYAVALRKSYRVGSEGDLRDPEILVRPENRIIGYIAEELTEGLASRDAKAERLLTFVRQTISYDYKEKRSGQDYRRHPIVTLYERRGDGEDVAYLYASLCRSIGIQCVLLEFNDHIATAVAGEFDGVSYTFRGTSFFFAEASNDRELLVKGRRGGVGWAPPKYREASASVYGNQVPLNLDFHSGTTSYSFRASPDHIGWYERSDINRWPDGDIATMLHYCTVKDPYLKEITKILVRGAKSDAEKIRRIREYIGANVTYRSDGEDKDYWRYPLQTISDRGGDCEDSSLLLATMLRQAGIECCLLVFHDHVAVGVSGDFDGTFYSAEGRSYFTLESTSPEWQIGAGCDKYESAQVLPLP